MKINKFLIGGAVATLALAMGSCTGDLDKLPTDPNQLTPEKFAQDPAGYLDKAIAGVYLQYATYGANGDAAVKNFDGGMSTFQRATWMLEECPTDAGSWIALDEGFETFQYGPQATNNSGVMGVYSRFFINIALCNQFIQTVDAGYFNLTTDALRAKAEDYKRQARILRAGSYFYAIDAFGNVPWADESVPMGTVAPQMSRDFKEGRRLVYEEVVADLEDLVAWYEANDPAQVPAYGQVGLDVAESLLVKFYLNAEVYSGTPAWDKCYAHAQNVIARRAHGGLDNSGLCPNYFQNFGANNAKYVLGNGGDVQEILWTIPQHQTSLDPDGRGLMSYANATMMCNAWIGDAPEDKDFRITISEYNSGNGWKCIVARPQFVERFEWKDAAMSVSDDVRVRYWKTSKDGFNIQNTILSQSAWGENGYLAPKYNNWAQDDNGIDLAASPAPTDQLGGDYAMIRLAEIYLSAAEAALHGGGSSAKALEYVNLIRKRAGMRPLTEINLVQLEDERLRELYSESVRRTDLIRYGKWLSGYTWSWKNFVADGADYPEAFIVYPLPSTMASRNGYIQNPNY